MSAIITTEKRIETVQGLLSWHIETADDARAFVVDCIAFFGLGWHPDTPGSDYVAYDPARSGARVFSGVEAETYDALLAESSSLVDVYGLGAEIFEKTAANV